MPDTVVFAIKTVLAQKMRARAPGRRVPTAWVTADTALPRVRDAS
jgi:hypothetical protein